MSETQGYDHNYIVNGKPGSLRDAAHAYCEGTGISMRNGTTMPGLQFYTANYLVENSLGKAGCKYGPHHGFCFEAQQVPDAPNHPGFPSAVLKAGSIFNHTTTFLFFAK